MSALAGDHQLRTIETEHPGAAGPSAVVAVALADPDRPWDGMDPRRPRGDDRGLDRWVHLGQGKRHPHCFRRHRGFGCVAVCGGCLLRRPPVWTADGRLRPKAPVHDHARRVPGRHGGHRIRLDAVVLLRLPLGNRHGHRRRIQRDQLGDRRADPGPAPGTNRHHHQRHLLGRRGCRRAPLRGRSAHLLAVAPVASLLRARLRPRNGDSDRPPARSREPAVAVHPRARGRGRGGHARYRASGHGDDCRQARRTRA